MRLKKIILRNFRCFEKLDLDLHPRLTVLVAENGGGKTAILDGIAIGLSPVLRYLSSASQRLSGPGILDTDFRLGMWQNSGSMHPPYLFTNLVPTESRDEKHWMPSDYAQVVIETTTGLKWDHWRASAKGKQPETKVGQSDLAANISDILDSLKTPEPKLLPVFAYYGARRGWIVIPERIRESKVDYTHPTSALADALKSLNDFKEMIKWFDQEEAAELRANKGCSPENFEEQPALSAVRSALSAILGGSYKNPYFNKKHKFVIESQNGPGELQVSQLSQGYQSMLAMGMDFARRLALANGHLPQDSIRSIIQENFSLLHSEAVQTSSFNSLVLLTPAIMLVDEIDLHLHPSWQQRVLGDLMRAFPCTQFIVSTHSPQVLTTVRKENIRVLSFDENGDGTARQPAISPLGHESGDALASIQGTHPRPELPNILSDIHTYEQLARSGRGDTAEAQQVKARLDAAGFEFNEADKALFGFLTKKSNASKASKP